MEADIFILLSNLQAILQEMRTREMNFIKLIYNDNHQSSNVTIPLIATESPLSLSRVLFITSRETASASESVMNGLKPYMNVISIGDTTDGKPVGMSTGDIGKKYFIAPVTFKNVNKYGRG